MKTKHLSFLLFPLVVSSCSSWVRIGDLTSVSNRNIDDSKTYVLLSREVESIADSGSDALEQAVDNLTRKYEGEFLRNAKIFVKDDGKKVKVIGDVWGIQNTNVLVNVSAKSEVNLELGDTVAFKLKGKIIEGKIIGISTNHCIVEYNGGKKIELAYDKVTKTSK
ncbi:hypothetical protein PG326_05425 [Riemerella anatipestifer]|uniref:hypothetical protein n=1 Tax=Riemerella anatipestifer TaxID=34085 RepID=UPI00129E5FD1|nr:hypothetical protein [Riemerella anatipestifer]MDY3345085.1 hypothetical protein [Riemerella anatipestifer]MDY3357768.1 hypothetical protein [Riemerella anatipestifer]MRM84206.1 hypothetical protein [Riemerella anatipestifer]